MTIASRNGNFLGSQLPPGTRNQEPRSNPAGSASSGTRLENFYQAALSGWDQAANYLFERLQQRIDLATLCLEAAPGAASSSNYLFFRCIEQPGAASSRAWKQHFFLYAAFERLELQSSSKLRCLGAAWKQVEQPGAALFSLFALPGSRVKDVLSRIKRLELHLISGFRCLEAASSRIRAAWQAGVYLFRAA